MDPNKFGNTNADSPTSFADLQIQKLQQSPSFNAGEGATSTQEALGTIKLSTPDQTVKSIQVDEVEIPRYMGSEGYQKAFGTARKAGLETFEFPKGSGKMFTTELGPSTETQVIETEVTDTIPGESRTVSAGSPGMAAFSKGLDSAIKLPKFTYNKKGSAPSGTADTFTSFDTRQAARKAIVEGRRQKQAAIRQARAKMKAGDITRRQFKELKDAAKIAQTTKRVKDMDLIGKQGELQRQQMKNPRISETMPRTSNGKKNRFKSSASMSQLMADVKAGKAFNKN